MARTVQKYGRLDVVVNNAGYANLASFEHMDATDFRSQIETNFFGVINVTRAALPIMRRQSSGHIINVSSLGSRVASPGLSAYQSAKWAVSGFSEILAQEVAPLGIRVIDIEPGGMQTDWAGKSMHVPPIGDAYQSTVGRLAQVLSGAQSRPLGDPQKVADIVVQLTQMDKPPPRLLLGSDSFTYASVVAKQLSERDQQWEQMSRSTDRDDATDADRDPMQTGSK